MSTIISILSELKSTIKRNLVWIVGIAAIASSIQAYITRSYKPEYSTYSKIFPLSINKAGGGSSPVDAIRAQFGISDKTDYEKIYNVKELVTSRTISENVVKSKPKNKKYKTIAEWLIDDHNKNLPFWKKKIKVSVKDSNDKIYTGAGLFLKGTVVNNDLKTNFTTITSTAHEEALVQEMNDKTLEELSNYYIKLVTEKPRTDLYKIKLMRDSLQRELYSNERAIAGFIDSNQMSVKSSTQLPQYKLVRAQKEIEALYTTTAQSYQNAKFKLLSESPIFQVLDKAAPPYGYSQPDWKKSAMIVFFLVSVLMCFFVCRKIIGRLIIEELSKD